MSEIGLKNKLNKNVLMVMTVIFIAIALSADTVLVETNSLFDVITSCMKIDYTRTTLIAVASYFLLKQVRDIEYDIWVRVLAVFYALFMLVGRSYFAFNTWDFIFYNPAHFVFAIIIFCGYYCFFAAIIALVMDKTLNYSGLRKLQVEKISLVKVWLATFLCYLPFIVIFFPGSIASDGYKQLRMFFFMEARTTQHPFFSTLVMGLIVACGRLINDTMGIFLLVFLQVLLGSFFASLIIKWAYEQKIPLWLKRLTFAYFTLIPLWGGYLQCVIKDAMYYVLFMTMYWCFCLIILNEDVIKSKLVIAGMIIMIAAAALWRRESTIVVFITSIVVFFMIKQYKKQYVAIVAGVFALIMTFELVIVPFMHVYPGDIYCKYSIIWQMSARYVCDHKDEITDEEADILRAMMKYDEIEQRYDPLLSDPIKETIEFDSDEEKDNYARVMRGWFAKHPDTFIQAIISHCYGYFYPDFEQHVRMDTHYYIKEFDDDREVFDVHYFMPEWIREAVDKYTDMWLKLPVVSLLLRPSTPLWINLFCMVLIIRKKKYKYMIGLMPVLLGIGACFIAPVNGLIRYSISATACIPVMIVYTLVVLGQENSVVPSEKI